MDSFDLLSIPRFDTNSEVKPKSQFKDDLISKLISQSNERKKQRLSSDLVHKNESIDDNKVELEVSEEEEDKVSDNITEEDVDEDINEETTEDLGEEETVESFPVIGQVLSQKIQRVSTISQKWITEPIVFKNDIKEIQCLDQFSQIIDKSLINLMSENGVKGLFPVQRQVIPYLLKSFSTSHLIRPKDVCVCSPTGSGKTLSFVIPIIQYLRQRVVTKVRVLVVLPVRDLAIQVFQVFQNYCKRSSLKVGLVVGHKSFAEECDSIIKRSIVGSKFQSLVDILVATPGKLVDLIQRGEGFDLSHLEILVLDESDRMIGELQFNWLQEIESSVFTTNRKYQCFCSTSDTMSDNLRTDVRHNIGNECSCHNWRSINCRPIHKILFSATLSTDPEKLKFISLFEPILFRVSSDMKTATEDNRLDKSKHIIPEELKEFMIIATEDRKPLIIWYLIEVLKYRKVLCFTGSVENSHRLYSLLKGMSKLIIAEYSSRLTAKKREKLLNHFTSEKIDLIICSDIFARGLDIDGVECVICYDPPRNETQYIHRVGRTARAGNEGTAIMLVTPTQLSHFNIISRRVHQKYDSNESKDLRIKKMNVKESELKPLITKYKKCLEKLSIYIKLNEKKKKILKRNFKH